MKERILKIIQGPPQSEPIYQLEFEYKKLIDDKQKEEFFSIIKSLALNGTEKEKFASLTTIEFLDKAKESEDVIKSSIEEVKLKENERLISPLLTLCAVLSTSWAIDFIEKVIKYFKPKSNEYSYYFDVGIRSIVSTIYWKEVINEIKWAIENYDNDYTIDFIAYFKWKQGEKELKEFFSYLDDPLLKKVSNLKAKIEDRYKNHYRMLRQILVVAAKGGNQAHHLLGGKITRALNNHPTLKGAFDYSRTNSKYIYNALDDAAHKGYQSWHRQYDATVVKWLQNNPAATSAQFDKYLHNLHQQPWLKSRISNVNLK